MLTRIIVNVSTVIKILTWYNITEYTNVWYMIYFTNGTITVGKWLPYYVMIYHKVMETLVFTY